MFTLLVGTLGGVVRIINRHTAERALLKGFSGNIIDLSFAHLNAIVLGAVDAMGNMFIYEMQEQKSSKIE